MFSSFRPSTKTNIFKFELNQDRGPVCGFLSKYCTLFVTSIYFFPASYMADLSLGDRHYMLRLSYCLILGHLFPSPEEFILYNSASGPRDHLHSLVT